MVTNWYVIVCGLAGLVATCVVGDVAAQANNNAAPRSASTCNDEIAAAEAQYRDGAFPEAIGLAAECLNRMNTSPEETVKAYRVIALAHLKQSKFSAARTAIVNLFGADPDYEPDPIEEPPVFVSMVSLVQRQLELDRPPMPLEKVKPDSLAVLRIEQETRRPTHLTTDRFTGASATEGAKQGSFFRRPGTWITVGGVLIGGGVRSGNHVRGIGISGLGVGAGGRFTGIGIGGLGVGGGEALEGIMLGGVAVGSGGRIDGVAIGGLGVGSGQSIRGVALGGLGVGTGGSISGGAFALLAVGGGGNVTGLTVAGLGIGAGAHLRGLHLAGVGILAPRLSGVVASPIVSSKRAAGLLVAPLYMRIVEEGHIRGLSISPLHHIKGTQQGLTVGLINVARTLRGVQLGLFNYAGNNPWPLRLLPGINLHF